MDKTILQAVLLEKIGAEVSSFLQSGAESQAATFAEMEQHAREFAQRVGRAALQAITRARAERASRGYRGPSFACPDEDCRRTLKFMEHRARSVRTFLGTIEYERSYYWGGRCGHSACPLDDELAMVDGDFSPLLKDGIAVAAALDAFRGGADQLKRFALVDVSPTAVRTNGEEVGRFMLERAAQLAEKVWCFDDAGRAGCEGQSQRAKDTVPEHGIVIADGTMIPVVASADHVKKKRRGEAEKEEPKTSRVYEEVKVGMVFRGEDWVRPKDPKGRGQIIDKEFVAHLGSKDDFGPMLWEVIKAWRIDEAPIQTFLGDGATWLWDLAAMFLPQATQVIDVWHLAEKISMVARAVYGEKNPFAEKWSTARYEEILEKGIKAVEQLSGMLAQLKPKGEEAKKVVRELRTYLANNKERMAYDRYRQEGRPISSAPIEGANEHLVSKRMEVTGARWTREGANAILAERCAYFSGRWDDKHRAVV